MQGIAAHALKEWQAKIEQKLPLGLPPETIAMLVKAATELERSTLGVDREEAPVRINVLFERGDGSVSTAEALDREQYAQLTEDERRAESQWRNPPKLLEAEDDQVN